MSKFECHLLNLQALPIHQAGLWTDTKQLLSEKDSWLWSNHKDLCISVVWKGSNRFWSRMHHSSRQHIWSLAILLLRLRRRISSMVMLPKLWLFARSKEWCSLVRRASSLNRSNLKAVFAILISARVLVACFVKSRLKFVLLKFSSESYTQCWLQIDKSWFRSLVIVSTKHWTLQTKRPGCEEMHKKNLIRHNRLCLYLYLLTLQQVDHGEWHFGNKSSFVKLHQEMQMTECLRHLLHSSNFLAWMLLYPKLPNAINCLSWTWFDCMLLDQMVPSKFTSYH